MLLSLLELTKISFSPCEIYISITISIDQFIYQRIFKIMMHLNQHLWDNHVLTVFDTDIYNCFCMDFFFVCLFVFLFFFIIKWWAIFAKSLLDSGQSKKPTRPCIWKKNVIGNVISAWLHLINLSIISVWSVMPRRILSYFYCRSCKILALKSC